MKRKESALDSKQVLTVIEKYSEVLELLDAYKSNPYKSSILLKSLQSRWNVIQIL